MQLSVIGAESSGISYLVSSGSTRVLIDWGISAYDMRSRLAAMEIDPQSIAAAVLTHEHSGHTRGLMNHGFGQDFPVFTSHWTGEVLRADEDTISRVHWNAVPEGGAFQIDSLSFQSFPVHHDAIDPLGYLIEDLKSGFRLGVTGDVGHVTTNLTDSLATADWVLIHANHDEDALKSDSTIEPNSKARLTNRHGHLSNQQARDLAVVLACRGRLDGVLLGHLDERCNTPARAIAEIDAGLAAAARPEIRVRCLKAGQTHEW